MFYLYCIYSGYGYQNNAMYICNGLHYQYTMQQVSSLHVNVKPSSYSSRMNCTDPCLKLNNILANKTYFMSNAPLHFLAGDHKLVGLITVRNVRNFSMVGQQNTTVTISCESGSSQIFFIASFNLSIANITFINCGSHYSSSAKLYKNIFQYMAAVIVYYRCIRIK